MSEIESRYISGYRCDATNCDAKIQGRERPYWDGMTFYSVKAIKAGWRFYASRSQRHYCPDHGPSPRSLQGRHPMRDVTAHMLARSA